MGRLAITSHSRAHLLSILSTSRPFRVPTYRQPTDLCGAIQRSFSGGGRSLLVISRAGRGAWCLASHGSQSSPVVVIPQSSLHVQWSSLYQPGYTQARGSSKRSCLPMRCCWHVRRATHRSYMRYCTTMTALFLVAMP